MKLVDDHFLTYRLSDDPCTGVALQIRMIKLHIHTIIGVKTLRDEHVIIEFLKMNGRLEIYTETTLLVQYNTIACDSFASFCSNACSTTSTATRLFHSQSGR